MAPHQILHLVARTVAKATVSTLSEIAPTDANETMSTIPGGSLLSKLTHPSIHTTRVFILLGIHFLSFLVLWNIPYLGRILDPHKLLVVAFHEFSHALVGKCTGAVIESIEVTPDQGDATRLRGGNACLVLPAGYIGSSVIGSALIFCTFNLMACKIAAGFVALSMVLTMWWARDHSFTRWLTHFWLAVLVYEWAVFEYGPQFYVIAMGVMSVTYSFWDMVEDLIRRLRVHTPVWGVFWFFISLLILALTIVLAMLFWP